MLAVTHTPSSLGSSGLGISASAALRADMIKYLGPLIGSNRAGGMFDKIMAAIREEAGVGAKTKVMPLIIGALAVSGLIAAVGIGAIVAKKRRQRKS